MKYLLFTLLILSTSCCSILALNNYELLKHEKVYFLSDKDIYVAGDKLFYTLYLKGITGQTSKYVYLVLRDRHNDHATRVRVELFNQMAFGNIYLSDTLHSDIYQLVCYTNCMRNEGEDLYFTKEIAIVNRFDKNLEQFDSTLYISSASATSDQYPAHKAENENLIIHLDKQVFNTREKVTLSLEIKNISEDSIMRLSVSVKEIIPGIQAIPSIVDYFSDNNKTVTPGEPTQYHSYFQSEIKGTSIQGKVLPVKYSDNKSLISNGNTENDRKTFTLLISTPDSVANMQYTTADSSGSFRFILNPYYEGKELIISLKENSNAVIELDDKFKISKPFIPSERFNFPGIKTCLSRSINIFEVQRYYSEKKEIDTIQEFSPPRPIPRVYYKPNSRVFPSDYLNLSDFPEISKELLPAMKVRKTDNNYLLSFADTRNKGVLDAEPVIFLDGVPINNANQIINLGTNKIKHIDILPVIRYYGEMRLSGILAVFSKNLEINNVQFTTPSIRYQPLPDQKFTKPKQYVALNINKHIPDFRQVLLWEPEIVLHNMENQHIEFYTSDLQGNYLITIQGITSNGPPINGSLVILVKNKSN